MFVYPIDVFIVPTLTQFILEWAGYVCWFTVLLILRKLLNKFSTLRTTTFVLIILGTVYLVFMKFAHSFDPIISILLVTLPYYLMVISYVMLCILIIANRDRQNQVIQLLRKFATVAIIVT